MNLNRYGAQHNLRAVNFICHAPQAQAVSIVGDFNQWRASTNPMKQLPDRAWAIRLDLKHGHHRYAFLIDGVVTLDPQAMGITRNDQNERVSLVAVS